MSKSVDFLRTHAELVDHDDCPDRAAGFTEAADELERLQAASEWLPWPPPDDVKYAIAVDVELRTFAALFSINKWWCLTCSGLSDLTNNLPTRWQPMPRAPEPT